MIHTGDAGNPVKIRVKGVDPRDAEFLHTRNGERIYKGQARVFRKKGFAVRELGIGDPDDRDILRGFQRFERLDRGIVASFLVQEIEYFGKDKIRDDSRGLPIIYRTDDRC